jgi:hypothetical protein
MAKISTAVGGFVSDTEISKIALVRSLSNTDS